MSKKTIKLGNFDISVKVVQSYQSEEKFIEYASKIAYFDLPEKIKVANFKEIYKIAHSQIENKPVVKKK